MPLRYALSEQREHPCDVVEAVALRSEWSFERSLQDEVLIPVKGKHADYTLTFTWLKEMETLHLGCACSCVVPISRKSELTRLVTQINEHLWIGHFDLCAEENTLAFRHALLLTNGTPASLSQCEEASRIALKTCDRYYQAMQFVIWAGQSASDALFGAMFTVEGQA